MSKVYIGSQIETEHGPGAVIDVFQKGEELFAEVRLESGQQVFVGIERSQFPDEAC